MGKNREDEQMLAIQAFIDQGVIEDVLGVVKSGKEATVYCCTDRDGGLVAAKVYRARTVRSFSNAASYESGRLRRNNRYERAIAQKSRRGREFAFTAWVSAEYQALTRLHSAGATVPRPIAQSDSVILMQYIGDETSPAPVLAATSPEPEEAAALWVECLRNIELALSCDRIHADLSPFNVLYWDGRPWIIDFPQAVDARFNANAASMLTRDIENLYGWFERHRVRADPQRISRELWVRYIRAEL